MISLHLTLLLTASAAVTLALRVVAEVGTR